MTISNIYKFYLGLAIVLIGFSSCDGDSFSQVAEIDFPEHTPKLAITAKWMNENLYNSNMPTQSIFVTHSLGALENEDFKVLDDAQVKMEVDGEELSGINFDPSKGLFSFDTPLPFDNYGATYTLTVEHPTYGKATASQILPAPVDIIKAEFEPEGGFEFDYKVDAMTVKLKDEYPNQENFYLVQAFELHPGSIIGTDTTWFGNRLYLLSDNPIASPVGDYSNRGLAFSDATFDGQEFTLDFKHDWIISSPAGQPRIDIVLTHITEEGFYHLKSLKANEESQDNPFAQPVTIYENIDGGHGIFTLSYSTSKRATIIQ